ncbi:MAG TPA: alpha/beta hydrolase [Steroidobacteraceae bacterium]|nr:alpha/beta hydrolase [Steroidobacteraceae bacterium]
MQTHYVRAHDGTQLYWTEWGSGPPILFSNSAGMPTEMWDYQMGALADHGFRCIAFDRRGHGRSDVPPRGYDFDTFADDMAALIQALDLKQLTLIAHSMGGGEVVRYLTRHGNQRVSRIVLIGSTTPFQLQAADNPNGIPAANFEALRASWRKDYPRWIAENTAPFFVPETSPAMARWLSGLLMRFPARIAVALNEAIASADFRRELPRISVPALVIHGDRDVSAPLALTGKPTAELIPGCRFKVYEGAPHGLLYTHMDRLHADILEFIAET